MNALQPTARCHICQVPNGGHLDGCPDAPVARVAAAEERRLRVLRELQEVLAHGHEAPQRQI